MPTPDDLERTTLAAFELFMQPRGHLKIASAMIDRKVGDIDADKAKELMLLAFVHGCAHGVKVANQELEKATK